MQRRNDRKHWWSIMGAMGFKTPWLARTTDKESTKKKANGAPSWLARDFQTMLSNGLRCFPECQLLWTTPSSIAPLLMRPHKLFMASAPVKHSICYEPTTWRSWRLSCRCSRSTASSIINCSSTCYRTFYLLQVCPRDFDAQWKHT